MSRIVQTKRGPYKMKHRLPPISRLTRYENPLPMIGDPPDVCGYLRHRDMVYWPKTAKTAWERRCHAVYAAMMEEKRGIVPRAWRRGLWMHIIPTTKS